MTAMVESVKVEEGKASKKIMNFDDILPYVGEASRYQWFLFFLLLPFTFVYAFLYFAQFFITLVPAEHWCTVPELDHWNLTHHEQWVMKAFFAICAELLRLIWSHPRLANCLLDWTSSWLRKFGQSVFVSRREFIRVTHKQCRSFNFENIAIYRQ